MPPPPQISFPPGKISYSPQAQEALQRLGTSGLVFLKRHISGDWGDVDAKRSQVNAVMASGGRGKDKDIQIISRYTLADGQTVIMISTRHVHTPGKRRTEITLAENESANQPSKKQGAKKKKDGQQLTHPTVQPGHPGHPNGSQLDRPGSHPERVINRLARK